MKSFTTRGCRECTPLFVYFLFLSASASVVRRGVDDPSVGVILSPGGVDFGDIFGSKFTTSETLAAFIKFNDWSDTERYPEVEFNAAEREVLDRREAEHDPNDPFRQFDDNIDSVARRKEYRLLSDDERKDYHDAIIEMKTTFSGGASLSEYDLFVDIHRFANAPGAHEGPGFLPWHREYINR